VFDFLLSEEDISMGLIAGHDRGGSAGELELSSQDMRDMVEQAMSHIIRYIETLPEQPASNLDGAESVARSLIEPLPQRGIPFSSLLDLLFGKLIPVGLNSAGPGYLAYIPGGGIFHGALADLISDAVNRYVGVWLAAPALAQIENVVLRWFSEIVGYPPEARGTLTTGGSLANLTALVTARIDRLPEDFLRGTIYASDQVHHSLLKAASVAGFPAANFRQIPSDRHFRIPLDVLQQQISEDRRNGWQPFLIVGNAGTANTGASDDLDALAQMAQEENLWLHVDAAYGGFFMLTERGREVLRGIDRADSITMDPHKALFLPYGNGCLLVRKGEALRRAHSSGADYMPPMQKDPDFVDFCEYSPELSRDFRGLRVWLPFKIHGIGPFRQALDEKLDLARWANQELRRIPGIEIVAEPKLSLVVFRWFREGIPTDQLNGRNREFLERINSRKRVFLTSTMLGNRFVLRICILSFRTHADRVQQALEDIRACVPE
jgi:aromatic-L-amino-acid decarboxylase